MTGIRGSGSGSRRVPAVAPWATHGGRGGGGARRGRRGRAAGCCWPAGRTCCCPFPRCSRSGCRTWARARRSPSPPRSRSSRGGRRWRRRCRWRRLLLARRGRRRRCGRWRWRWSTAGSAASSSGCPAARSTCTTCRGSTDVREMLATFADHILTDQPVHWTTHVGAHPPGVFLFYVVLDRIGLGGGGPAGRGDRAGRGVGVRRGGGRRCGRWAPRTWPGAALPFGVLLPGRGVGRGVGGRDVRRRAGLGRGAARGRRAPAAGCGPTRPRWPAGCCSGCTLYLSYGLVLAAAPAGRRRWRRPGAWRAAALGGAGAVARGRRRSPRPGSGGSPGSRTSG